MRVVGVALIVVSLTRLSAVAGAIPPAPAQNGAGQFTHDYTGVLEPEDKSRIAAQQQEAFESHRVPIIVVTMHRMAIYGYQGDDIQPFAEQWFNKWRIGAADSGKGILVLVSVGDRKARIELGAD